MLRKPILFPLSLAIGARPARTATHRPTSCPSSGHLGDQRRGLKPPLDGLRRAISIDHGSDLLLDHGYASVENGSQTDEVGKGLLVGSARARLTKLCGLDRDDRPESGGGSLRCR